MFTTSALIRLYGAMPFSVSSLIARCLGWNAPKNAALIVAALEAHNSELYTKFPLDGSVRLNEQSAVKASGEVESAPEPKPAARKSR
jgi:hypothetical protein